MELLGTEERFLQITYSPDTAGNSHEDTPTLESIRSKGEQCKYDSSHGIRRYSQELRRGVRWRDFSGRHTQ